MPKKKKKEEPKYFFKVQTGYKASEYVIVEAGPELEKILYAFIEGDVVANVKGMAIRGRHIISIKPDVHSYTGWFRSYEPKTGDDFRQIERDVPKEIENVMNLYQERVTDLIQNNNAMLIGKAVMQIETKGDVLQLTEGRK